MLSNKLSQYQGRAAVLRARAAQLCKQIEQPRNLAVAQCQQSEKICRQAKQISNKSKELRERSEVLRKRLADRQDQFSQNNPKDSQAVRSTVEPHRESEKSREPADQQEGKARAKVGADNERIAFGYRGHVIYVIDTLEGWKPMVDHWILPMRLTLGDALWLACTFINHGQICSAMGQVLTEMFEANHLSQEECLNLLSSLHDNIGP